MTYTKIRIATENGTGSSTANAILAQALMKEGHQVSSKNLFPSNIAGLPTEYLIKVKSKKPLDLYVGFNKKTLEKDLQTLASDAFVVLNSDFKPSDFSNSFFGLECRKLTKDLHPSATTRKLLYNMLYVGAVAKLLHANLEHFVEITKKNFRGLRDELLEANIKALRLAYELCEASANPELLTYPDRKSYVYNGNSCAALGFLDGGAQVVTWYPITPSSSVAENFEAYSKKITKHPEFRSVLQCEDEIASAVAAVGAGWSGASSFTATSGPGLSLMQEALGLAYFTEIPFVLLDVQRAGPSTGLPTRTAQGDLLMAHYSSHGDTIHPVLLPGSPQQMYDDAFQSLNLAQNIQSPVMILSDLDLGMNDWQCPHPLKQNPSEISAGKVALEEQENFKRFSNEELVATRSLPRLSHPSLSYFTRGSGHNEDSSYSEDPVVYNKKLQRLKKKVLESKKELQDFYPQDEVFLSPSPKNGLIFWGTTLQALEDLKELLPDDFSFYQVRSLPLDQKLFDFIEEHEQTFVVEQNRDGQLHHIIKACNPSRIDKTVSICQSNGQPVDAVYLSQKIMGVI